MNREQTGKNPKLCECGCGRPTLLSDRTNPRKGSVRGQPLKFILGHNARDQVRKRLDLPPPNPSGICQCGCGQKTELAPYSSVRFGWVIDQPKRFINHHWAKTQNPDPWNDSMYEIRDMGYNSLCWHWMRNKNGASLWYGKYAGMGAHVYSYILHKGSVPDGLELDHLCGNPSCVNPDHLEPVPHRENVRRGRKTKISQSDIDRMRSMTGTNKELASIFGIHESHVSRLRRGILRSD